MLRLAFVVLFTLSACTPVSAPPDRLRTPEISLPTMKRFDGKLPRPVPMPDNAQLLRDFMELSFQLESGRKLPVFTRFEGPITVAVADGAPSSLAPDLDDLLHRFRVEAGIDIAQVPSGRAASITIEALPREAMQAMVPQAACFVVPNVSSWVQFVAKRRSSDTDWGTLTNRSRVAVFLPSDVSPQEVRDCLHEEIAQALGPLNDLYRLPFTVFNDDNMNTILTQFDMTILRATYAPELQTGMSAQEVADALPAILARVHPAGAREAADPAPVSTREWSRAIERAVSPRSSDGARARSARDALEQAQEAGWTDTRLGYSLLTFGRENLGTEPERAISAIVEAAFVFRTAYGDDVHVAHTVVQPAAFALTSGQPDVTLRLTAQALPAALKGQNAALLSTLMLLRAEAMESAGRSSEAASLREEGKAWALYGYGSDQEVQAHVAEVAALRPGV